jgi:hypothetical protein
LIKKYSNKPLNWGRISANPNISLEIIEKYIDKIDFSELSNNKFTYHNKKRKIYEKIMLFYYLTISKCIYDINRYCITF